MKLEKFSNNTTTLVIGDMPDKKFGIIANDKMFNILSDKIYTDKIMAPIRELATNAYDARVDNNKESIPFEVHIPTFEEPYFSIRDYGKGMNDKQIEELYTTYGWSDKNNSNKFTGCLGLGSKSPFAYTDTFNIHSVNNGKKYIYCCYMEEGIPHVMKFDEFQTDEDSGLMIKFDVKKQDVSLFENKIDYVFKWFKIKPLFNKQNKFYSEFIIENNCIINNDNCGILMGNIFYPDFYFVIDYIKEENLMDEKFEYFFKNCNKVVICANIGDYDIAVSREQISKSKKNCQKLYETLKDFLHHQYKKYDQFIQKLEGSILNQYNEVYSYHNNHPYINIYDWITKNVYVDFSQGKNHLIHWKNANKVITYKLEKNNLFIYYLQDAKKYRVILDKTCKSIYKQYVKEKNRDLFVVSEKEIYDKIIKLGIQPADTSNIVLEKGNETLDGKLYVIHKYKYNGEFNLVESNMTIKKVLEEKRVLYYLPFYKGKPEVNFNDMNVEWIKNLENCSFFKHKFYITYHNETKKLKNAPHCYNVIELLKTSFRNIKNFHHINYMVKLNFSYGVEQIIKNINFNFDIMDEKTKKSFMSIKKHYMEMTNFYLEYNKLTNHEKLYYSLFCDKISNKQYFLIIDYLNNQYPLLKNYMGYEMLNNIMMQEIQWYIDKKDNEYIMKGIEK